MRNSSQSETLLLESAEQKLRERLPATWRMRRTSFQPPGLGVRRPDAVFQITAPTGQEVSLNVEAKNRLDPRDVNRVVDALTMSTDTGLPLVVAPFLGPLTRQRLVAREANYADLTGNLRLAIEDPLVFIETMGSDRDPAPEERPLRTLKGRGAGRCVRALCDFMPPYGIRDLAKAAALSPATLSRVVDLLDRDGLLDRDARGGVRSVDVSGVIRRWTWDYSFEKSNEVRTYLEPRGLATLEDKIASSESSVVLTGSFAVSEIVRIAVPRLLQIYARDPSSAADSLGLRETDSAANVMLARPFDDVVFERTAPLGRFLSVALPQLAADLLTSPGRSPSEGDALLKWMEKRPDEWRIPV